MVEIPGPSGPLEALIDAPAGPVRAAAVFAHPHPQYGGTMHTKVVFRGAKALAHIGCEVIRFNFRGVGQSAGEFDRGPGEMADFQAAIDFMAARHPGLPIWAVGMSFGSWVALETGADDDRVSLLLAIAPPVDRYDFTSVRRSAKPTSSPGTAPAERGRDRLLGRRRAAAPLSSSPTIANNWIGSPTPRTSSRGDSDQNWGGGAIYASATDMTGEPIGAESEPTIVNNVIAANGAWRGGGVALMNSIHTSATVVNNTIVGNSGAGIWWENTAPKIANNVVAFNSIGLSRNPVGRRLPGCRGG